MDKLLKSAGGTITLTIYNSDGIATDATGNVGVVVKDGAGTTVVSGNATKRASTTGIYDFTITALHAANLDVYTVTWSATVSGDAKTYTTYFEVVGGFYFSIAEARAFDNKTLQNTATYPTEDIINAREYVEDRIEKITGVSFVPRGKRLTVDGSGLYTLHLPDFYVRSIKSVTSDSVAYTSTELADIRIWEWGVIQRKTLGSFTSGTGNIDVYYEYGWDQPPEPIRHAALRMVVDKLVPSNIDDRTLQFTDDLGTRQFAVAGKRFPTGIPDVDQILHEFSEKGPVLA